MTMVIISGTFLSDVPCTHEKTIRAKRKNLDPNKCHIKYGSILVAVNQLQINGNTKVIDRNTDKGYEERLILEISYLINKSQKIIKPHQHIKKLQQSHFCFLKLNRTPYIKQNHEMKIIPNRSGDIKNYFVKVWANDVIELESNNVAAGARAISPGRAVSRLTKPIIIK